MENAKKLFILDLLNNKKLTHTQRNRVLRLFHLEIKKEGKKQDSENDKNVKPNPKHVAEFMKLFNEKDGLKYLTHDFEESRGFDIDTFLGKAQELFQRKTNNELHIPQSLYAIVKWFAFGEGDAKGWWSTSEDYKEEIKHTTGWASKEWRMWVTENELHPIKNLDYEKIISDFRRITRIGDGDFPKLLNTCIEEVFKSEKEEFEFEIKDVEKADFYSHVGRLKEAIITVFEEIKKRADTTDKKKISVRFQRNIDDPYFLRKIIITHHNSFPKKELALVLSEWNEKGNMGIIQRKLEGYCHWSVETLIENTPKRINILKEENTPKHETVDETQVGFTHIFTFYYR